MTWPTWLDESALAVVVRESLRGELLDVESGAEENVELVGVDMAVLGGVHRRFWSRL